MTNKKITDLVELTTPTTDDVFPLVDIATNGTRKAQLANLPISTATQTALDAKQATLVSGTNIKTINSTSLLGSGNIDLVTNPAGTAGQIQFSDGSAFAADSNLFWDNTNKRLGVGETTPTARVQIKGEGATSSTIALRVQNSSGTDLLKVSNDGSVNINQIKGVVYPNNGVSLGANFELGGFNSLAAPKIGVNGAVPSGTQVSIKGSGSTSATTALLVQNSSGTTALQVTDDRIVKTFNGLDLNGNYLYANGVGNASIFGGTSWLFDTTATGTFRFRNGSMALGASVADATAHLDVQSTTKGFLPPRMTTTQKNAIASPAAGLVVYDSTTNKLCCYNGTSWNDLF